jgi:hypothetical protein
VYPWKSANAAIDRLCEELQDIVAASEKLKRSRSAIFEKMWQAVSRSANRNVEKRAQSPIFSRAAVPHLNEPWYC